MLPNLGGNHSTNTKQASIFHSLFQISLKRDVGQVQAHWYFPTRQVRCQQYQLLEKEDDYSQLPIFTSPVSK